MKKKSEPGSSGSGFGKYKPILSHNHHSSSYTEQLFSSDAGSMGTPRRPYLTNTDKSPSTPVKNPSDFTDLSFDLYKNTKRLYKQNKKSLQYYHHVGWQTFKLINNNNLVLYSVTNLTGGRGGWSIAQNISNTDKARLASKQSAYEKALANSDLWEYFATLTLDKKKQARYDFQSSFNHVVKFLQRRGIRYFIVPERHKDGAWHFHALLSGDIEPHLANFTGKALKNPYIATALKSGKKVQHCLAYSQKFGYNTIEPIRNQEACVFYMTKYVLKTFDDPGFERVSRRRYFTSKGLKSPTIVMPESLDLDDFEPVRFSKFIPKVYLKRVRPASEPTPRTSGGLFPFKRNRQGTGP